jgi:Uma2 family endonuclease
MLQELETPEAGAPPAKMTYEEFLAWADEDVWAEWVDGEIIRMSPASKRHQLIANFLAALFQCFVETRQLGVIISAPFQMKTGPELPGHEPDILFIAREHLDRLQDTHLMGPADLVVEIVSPESRARDRGDKYYEYEQGGVREYWLIDPLSKQAELYRLVDGIFHPIQVGEDGIYHSAVLEGLWLRVDWLWQEPLPMLLTVLKEWGLI